MMLGHQSTNTMKGEPEPRQDYLVYYMANSSVLVNVVPLT